MEEDHRLSRIESKLDKLAEAVVSLARMEERMITLFSRMDRYEEDQDKFDERLTKVETDFIDSKSKVAFAERIFWIFITAASGAGFWILK